MNRRKFTYTYSPRARRSGPTVYTRIPRERGRTWLRRPRDSGAARGWVPLGVVVAVAGALALAGILFAGIRGSAPQSHPGPALAGIEGTAQRPRAPDRISNEGTDGGSSSGDGGVSPTIRAQGAVIIEAPCGAVIYAKSDHMRLAPASLTKIATALVIADRTEPSEVVQVLVNGAELSAASGSTVMGLVRGDRMTVRDLLYGMLLPSGNDAAIALAQHVSGTVPEFVELMNAKVRELGLVDTHFTNPHGLDDGDLYTSAYDIAILGEKLLQVPSLAQVVGTRSYQPAWDRPAVANLNQLLGQYPGLIGVKTGYTDKARHTIVAAAERDGRRLVVSALDSENAYADATTLLDWGFYNSSSACAGSADARVAEAGH